LGIVLAAISVTFLIAFSPEEVQQANRNLTIMAMSGIAAGSSIFAVLNTSKMKRYRLMLISFSIGIGLWFVAEATWNYYVIGLGIEVPYPSMADVFYLAAYPLIGYFLYGANKLIKEKTEENRLIATAITITIVAFIVNIFLLQIVESSLGFAALTADETVILLLSLAYPIIDGILLVPTIMILYTAYRNRLQAFSWVLLASSILVTAIADIGFGYTALVGIEALENEAIWDVLYNIMYILISGAMVIEILEKRTRSKFTLHKLETD
jgi:hypothetical protein